MTEIAKRFYQKHKERLRENRKKYYQENKDKILEQFREYYKNKKAEFTKRQAENFIKNRDKYNSRNAKRHARKKQACPAWLDKEEMWLIDEIYSISTLRTKLTGVKYHVDHIIPLSGKTVSGLHLPWNMQVITAVENLVKKNKYA